MPDKRRRIWQILLPNPYVRYMVADAVMLTISFFVIIWFFPLTTHFPFQKYDIFALVFSFVWIVVSYFCHRYVPVRYMKVGTSILRLVVASVFSFAFVYGYMVLLASGRNFSIWVLLALWIAMLSLSIVFLVVAHAYRYALNEEPETMQVSEREPQTTLKLPFEYEDEQRENIRQSIVDIADERVLKYLEGKVNLYSSNTYIVQTSELFNIRKIKDYRFDTIINFMPLNQIRGINKMLGLVNDKLPDDGVFVCCMEPQNVLKHRVLRSYPAGINWIVYTFLYLYKRVLPRLFMTSRLYYDITEGKDRMLSLAEVLGRLYYCGFEVVDEHKMDDQVYVVARRHHRPQTVARRLYGMFVKLRRVGKDGKTFMVYKFRTMHPYSEYLQQYMYERCNLREGGKFNHDIRVSTLGKFLRRCWLDELPMLFNVLKGDIKLVGVRPISKQYFSLYCKELQEKRVKHKPGLLPPFYADMPKTLEEIQDSEMRYLCLCEEKGTLRTDWNYFWKILYTILVKRARSK